MINTIKFKLNGKPVELKGDEERRLLEKKGGRFYFLRELTPAQRFARRWILSISL